MTSLEKDSRPEIRDVRSFCELAKLARRVPPRSVPALPQISLPVENIEEYCRHPSLSPTSLSLRASHEFLEQSTTIIGEVVDDFPPSALNPPPSRPNRA
ncbi:hypothetical protein KM043_006169 [Ampulex compressa]|nr:hypothetical protein KM043_006169 [Ampulex compressa]